MNFKYVFKRVKIGLGKMVTLKFFLDKCDRLYHGKLNS